MPHVDLVDYGGGNVGSVQRALTRLGLTWETVSPERPPTGQRPLVLPGVGSFKGVMDGLNQQGLAERLRQLIQDGTPYLGLCVGLQVLFDGSDENPGIPGLGILRGQVVRFSTPGLKVPQIGWNQITPAAPDSPWPTGAVYFVNSYVAQAADPADVLYQADYGGPFCAAVQAGAVTAFQFHPEKSGAFGHALLAQWAQANV